MEGAMAKNFNRVWGDAAFVGYLSDTFGSAWSLLIGISQPKVNGVALQRRTHWKSAAGPVPCVPDTSSERPKNVPPRLQA
jgi:hypothetical protein